MTIKINDKYENLFLEPTRYYVVTGGRGSSKSFSVNTYLALKTFEENNKILFTRYTMTAAETSIIPEFMEKVELMEYERYFHSTRNEIINTSNQSKVLFRGIKTSSGNQTANLKSLQGVTVWVLDEAEELVDETVFDKIDLSIRAKGQKNIVILILNPATKEHWIYDRFFARNGVQPGFNGVKGNTTYIHTDYRDNIENLDPSFLERVEQIRLTNPDKYNHVILGGWLNKAEGVVFENWSIGEFNKDLLFTYGLDFGFKVDPDALAKVAIDRDNKKIYLKEELYRNGLGSEQLSEIVHSVCGEDNQIIGDNAEGRLIDDLLNSGLNITACKKGAGSILAGIKMMQDYEFIVDPSSTNLIKELNNYVWDDKRSGKPIDAYNHLLDAIRYVCYYKLDDDYDW